MYFSQLGLTIKDAWAAKKFDRQWLPEIAAAALRKNPPSDHSSFLKVIEWVEKADVLPQQARLDEAFGQPPVTMFWDERFRIDVLFWHTATTGIHQHRFSGAFTLLGGSSVHSRYDFELIRSMGPALLYGNTILRDVEFLTPGSVREIASGQALIHALFHLDTPSVSVVVRTPEAADAGPEFEYKPPTLAIDPSHNNQATTKKLQLLRLLLRVDSIEYERLARQAMANSDLHTAFLVLRQARLHVEALEIFEGLMEVGRQRHGDDIDLLLPSLEEEWRRNLVIMRRKEITDPDHRFFLALLMNLPNQAAIRRVISSRHPGDDPLNLIKNWSRELSGFDRIGIEFDETIATLFGYLLEFKPIEETLTLLTARYSVESIHSQRDVIADACKRIQSSELLRPLFI
jgi:hypothetical protein